MKRIILSFGLIVTALLAGLDARAAGVLVRYRNSDKLSALTLAPEGGVLRIETEAEETDRLLEVLQADPDVEFAEPDYAIQPAAMPNDPLMEEIDHFYNYEMSQVIEAWDVVTDCSNIVVAVIDSGIDTDHPDLGENLWFNGGEIPNNDRDDDNNGYADDRNGYNFFDHNGHVNDDLGHGTAVAGVIGAVGDNHVGLSGICWSVQILPIKIFGSAGEGQLSMALQGIDYALREGARIINLSWTLTGEEKSVFLEEALKRAEKAGVLVVAAAGNDGQDLTTNPVYPAAYELSNLITVAAHDSIGQLLSFSNYGEGVVDVAAPGIDILTTGNKTHYTFFTGTSAAAPHVSGTAALLLSLDPSLDPGQVTDLLMENSFKGTNLKGLTVSSGNLNVLRAVSALGTADGSSLSDDEEPPSDSLPSLPAAGGCSLVVQ